jgi:hypothetical protein
VGRRRAQRTTATPEFVDVMPVSARVAWSYLAVLLAGVGAAFLLVLSNQTLARLACAGAAGGDDAIAGCKLGYAVWVTIGGFVVCLIPAVVLLKLDWWLWGTLAAGLAYLVAADGVTEWWWWLAALVVPAVASLLSANWGRAAPFRRVQLGILVALWLGAVAALLRWYVAAR